MKNFNILGMASLIPVNVSFSLYTFLKFHLAKIMFPHYTWCRGAFSLTKTATGILFKFSNIEDFQAVYKKGFHKVTGARFYKKVNILEKFSFLIIAVSVRAR